MIKRLTIIFLLFASNGFVKGMQEEDKENQDPRLKSLQELEIIHFADEMVWSVIMNTLPGTLGSNTQDEEVGAQIFIDALAKIIDILQPGNFSPPDELHQRVLIKEIKQRKYPKNILNKAVELAAQQNKLFVAVIAIRAGANLPYTILYEGLKVHADCEIKKILHLVKKLKQYGYMVDFNAMPYFDKELNKEFTSPLLYLLEHEKSAAYNHKEADMFYYRKLIMEIIAWGAQNGFLNNILAVDKKEDFNKIIDLLYKRNFNDFVLNLIFKDIKLRSMIQRGFNRSKSNCHRI